MASLSSGILKTLLAQLKTAGFSQSDADKFVSLIDQSPLLSDQLTQLQSTPAWTIIYQPGKGDITESGQRQISLQDIRGASAFDANPDANKVLNFDPASYLVGVLSHEVGHAEDPDIGISYSGNALAVGAETALEMLSEGKAQTNNLLVEKQLYSSGAGAIPVDAYYPNPGVIPAIETQVADINAGNLSQAVIDGAVSYLYEITSTPGNPSYLSYYWDTALKAIVSSISASTPVAVIGDLDAINMNAATALSFGQVANGTDTMSVSFSGGEISSYVDDFGNYGPINASGLSGAVAAQQPKSPSPSDVATYQQFNFVNGTYYLELFEPEHYTAEIEQFGQGDTIDLANVGVATGATLGADNALAVTGLAGGDLTLSLDPTVDYSDASFSVATDGAGGTAVTLEPATSHTITFSEYPVGTANPVYTYSDNTVSVLGEIVNDSAQPATPAAAANTSYVGPVFINFKNPVKHVDFDAGYFDNLGSTTISFIGLGGQVISSSTNTAYGIVHYTLDNADGISAVNVVNTAYDASGFSVDTVDFSGAAMPQPADAVFGVSLTGTSVTPGDPIFTFTITRSGDIAAAASVGYAVTGSGQNPLTPSDVVGGLLPVGAVSFDPGEASKQITVDVVGAFADSDPKTFNVSLIAPSADTTVGTSGQAAATTLTPPVISGAVAGQKTADTVSLAPFANLVITDPNAAQTETVTVVPDHLVNGSLSQFGSGSYDPLTGLYTISGTLSAVNAALDALVFTPTIGITGSTSFFITVENASGAIATDDTTSVAASAQPIAIEGPAAGGFYDLTSIPFLASDEVKFTATKVGGELQIVDTARNQFVVASLNLTGNYNGGIFTLTGDGQAGTKLGFSAVPAITLQSGDVETAAVPGGSPLAVIDRLNSDGSLFQEGRITRLANGNFDYHYAEGSFFSGKTFASFDNVISVAGTLLVQTLYNAKGSPIQQTSFNANGSIYLNYSIKYAGNGTIIYHFAGGSFFAGKSFASFDNVTSAAGVLLSQQLYNSNGTPTLQTFYNADGTNFLQATVTRLSSGDLDYHYSSGSYFVGKPFVAFDDIASATTGHALSLTFYDANGKITSQTTYNADGSLHLVYTVNKLANGTIDYHYAGGSFFNGKPFKSFDNVTSASGTLLSQTLDDASGFPYQQILFNANGSVYLQENTSKPASGQILYHYAGGSFFSGKAYSSFDNLATSGNTLLYQELYNTDGSHTFTVPGSSITVAAAKHDTFNVTGSKDTVRFNATGFGADTFSGYKAGDVFSFAKSIFADYSTLSGHLSGTTSAVITDTAGDTLTLANVSKASVTSSMFAFS